jgi:hypothetical protein
MQSILDAGLSLESDATFSVPKPKAQSCIHSPANPAAFARN